MNAAAIAALIAGELDELDAIASAIVTGDRVRVTTQGGGAFEVVVVDLEEAPADG